MLDIVCYRQSAVVLQIVLVMLHCKKKFAVFPSPAGMSLTGWGTGKPLTFFYSVVRQCATNYGHCDLLQCCCDHVLYLRVKKGGRYGKKCHIFTPGAHAPTYSTIPPSVLYFPFLSSLSSPPRPRVNFLLRHSSRSLPSSFFLFSASFFLSYSSIPPSSLRNVVVYFLHSYLTLLAFTILSYICLRLFSIVVVFFPSYYFPSLLFLLSQSLVWFHQGFVISFSFFCIYIFFVLEVVCLTSFITNEKLYWYTTIFIHFLRFKGTVHEIFFFMFFSWIIFPPSPRK